MKAPKTDPSKFSLPGVLRVTKNDKGLPVVYPAATSKASDSDNFLQVIYDNGPVVKKWDNFDTVRARLNTQWANSPPKFDVISDEMKSLISKTREEQIARNLEATASLSS